MEATYIAWERQSKETSKAYEVFCIYRDQGLERSCLKVAKECTKSESYIKRLSSKYDWVSRVQAFDDYIEAKVRARNENEIIEMRSRHAKQSLDLQDALTLPLEVLSKKLQDDPGVKELGELDIKELLGLITQGAKCLKQLTEIEREARGVSSKIEVAHAFEGKVDILKQLRDSMTPEQRERLKDASEDY